MHILLIDDDAIDRKSVRRSLTKSQLNVDIAEATDARSAKELFNNAAFDCVLMDYRLPDVDGISLAQELLASPKNGEFVPIVMLTGEGSEVIAVEAMKCGVQDYLPKHSITTDSLSLAINGAVEKAMLRKKIKQMNENFEHMALTDSLTGLGNRNLFYDRLNHMIATSRRNKGMFALLMMDLDKFKEVNDTHGHDVGDMVLREVSNRLRNLGRDADTFFRLGGDEFAGLFTTGVTRSGIEILAERIVNAIDETMDLGAMSLQLGVSIGIALFPENGKDGDDLLRKADAAMYQAKRGKLGYAFSSTGIRKLKK